jgi:pyruvate/2-oxoacid:ferredoxin oxidoreductase alpha subunit
VVMFNSIAWGQYLSAVALLLVLYYVFVGFKYFRWEILSLMGIKKVDNDTIIIPPITNTRPEENHEDYLPKPPQKTDTSPMVQPFTDEVQAYLNQTENDISKHELTDALQQLIEKYPVAQSAEYRNELVYFIASVANLKYPQLLRTNDITQLWN